jgi:biotin-[acetyl-CoA-carboxylase] ligase BirA-like protein
LKLPAGHRLVHFERIDSTNAEARRLAEAGETGPLWLWADEQTAGRGRLGRSWVSEPGNLYATFLFSSGAPAGVVGQVGFAAALAVHEIAARLLPGADVKLKWPNDVLIGGAKFCGLLAETIGGTIALGCGINLASAPSGTPYPVTSLARQGTRADVETLLGMLAEAQNRLAIGRGPGLCPHPPGLARALRRFGPGHLDHDRRQADGRHLPRPGRGRRLDPRPAGRPPESHSCRRPALYGGRRTRQAGAMNAKKKFDHKNDLVLLALGGIGEIGMNCYCWWGGPADDREWLMVDLGVKFGEASEPGIDVVLPDVSFIAGDRRNLSGLVLTHAHEDHIGAVAWLWPQLRCPVYCTPFAAEILKLKLKEAGLDEDVPVRVQAVGSRFNGPSTEFIAVTIDPRAHRALDRDEAGPHSSFRRWKIDRTPAGAGMDEKRLREIIKASTCWFAIRPMCCARATRLPNPMSPPPS